MKQSLRSLVVSLSIVLSISVATTTSVQAAPSPTLGQVCFLLAVAPFVYGQLAYESAKNKLLICVDSTNAKRTLEDAKAYCESRGERLPTAHETLSLIHPEGLGKGAVNQIVFDDGVKREFAYDSTGFELDSMKDRLPKSPIFWTSSLTLHRLGNQVPATISFTFGQPEIDWKHSDKDDEAHTICVKDAE